MNVLKVDEILKALLNGDKLTNHKLDKNTYFHMKGRELVDNEGNAMSLNRCLLHAVSLYIEPKKMIKVAKYAFDREDGSWDNSNRYYKSDEHFEQLCKHWKNFKRLDYTEIEVEDY